MYIGLHIKYPSFLSDLNEDLTFWTEFSKILKYQFWWKPVQWVDEWKTNLMSLAILFHFLCAQHVSDTNISIIRSLRLCWWITTSVVLFSVRCVLEIWCRTHDLRSGSQDHHPSKNSVQKTICCNSTSNAPDDGRMYPKHVELRIHQ